MSCNRENIVWRQPDGQWAIGFFSFYYTNQNSEDFDPEWDVDYDMGTFNWASSGHQTREEAIAAWNGSNPGMHSICENGDVAPYEQMLLEYLQRDKVYR